MGELEKIVLSYLIFDNEDGNLTEEDFTEKANKIIIKAINDVKSKKQIVNMISVADAIKTSQRANLLAYMSTLGDYAIGTTWDEVYVKIKEETRKRKAKEIINKADFKDDIAIIKMVNELQDIVKDTNENELGFNDLVCKTMEDIEFRTKNKHDKTLYTGILDLDYYTYGLHEQELTIIGARPRGW